MESVNDIKEALSARSRTATLDELRNQGRRKVRLIRAEHIAAMVSEAVHEAIRNSGLIDPAEHERLVEQSRAEFKEILAERERDAQRAQTVEQELEEQRGRFEECTVALRHVRGELEQAAERAEALEGELDRVRRQADELHAELTQARAEVEAAQAEAEQARSAVQAAGQAPAAGGVPNDLLLSLIQEMTALKASAMAQPSPAPGADMSAVLDKLTSSINDRLESFGKKMGISAAVESDTPTDFSGLFKGANQDLESNMDDVQLKQKTGGGIAANLAKLKKLKGGG